MIGLLLLSTLGLSMEKLSLHETVSKLTQENSGFQVNFQGEAGVYYLKNESKNFDSKLKDLKLSLSQKKKVFVEYDPTYLHIFTTSFKKKN